MSALKPLQLSISTRPRCTTSPRCIHLSVLTAASSGRDPSSCIGPSVVLADDRSLGSTALHPIIMTIFSERYRVIAVDSQSLVIRGISSGEVLVINSDPTFPLNQESFPVGKLIELSDPAAASPE